MLTLEYRPFSTEKMVGHPTVLKDITNRAKKKDFPQVMYFIGQTGAGKTTLANIVAAVLNCHSPITTENGTLQPCGECPVCMDIRSEKYGRDVTFLDGSSLGKDGIRQVQDVVSYDAMYDENRVIIIDEAQNLTKSGKEATLKLLERINKNTYFILCTMNKKAFDRAILSRGQAYYFEPLSQEDISSYLYSILEDIDPDEKLPEEVVDLLPFLAQNSEGSVRQAASYFERCLNSEIYSKDAATKEFGFMSEETTYMMLQKLINRDPEFFDDIQKTDVEKFFRYSWRVLANAAVMEYSTGLGDSEWKTSASKRLRTSPGFYDLLSAYVRINETMGDYFKDPLYLTHIVEYYRSDNVPRLERLQENKPVRKVRKVAK